MIHAVHSVKYGEEKSQFELRKLTKETNQLTREINQGIQTCSQESYHERECRRND